MHIIKPYYEILTPAEFNSKNVEAIYKRIEEAGRTCYKSEDRIAPGTAEKFVRAMVKNGHEAMLEHASMTVKFVVDRGISHELVRHRLCSFAQESTRYCNYEKDKFGNEITVIEPCFFDVIPSEVRNKIIAILNGKVDLLTEEIANDAKCRQYARWYEACVFAEKAYMDMLTEGAKPEEARDVLPNSVKTEIVATANMREWRNILKLRAAGERGTPHPQMLEVMVPLLNMLREFLPALFEDIKPMEI